MLKRIPLVLLLLLALPALADDYYLIEMNAVGQPVVQYGNCLNLFWDADAVFYNMTSQTEVVTLAGVSNGAVIAGLPASLNVPPSRATSLRQAIGIPWAPQSAPPMWVVHVTAPSSLLVESAMIPGLAASDRCLWVHFLQQYGKTQLPVFRSLVPASQRQLIGGLSVGDAAGHINVAIYNAGAEPATATIEVHRACDGAVTETRNVTIDANTAQQFTGFAIPDGSGACAPLDPSAATKRLAYVLATVDQPSLTFASVLGVASETDNQPLSTIQVMPGVAR
jgi:hypothetical protein